ncbi:hypothetical protein [Streptomyces microflavus]|uniref:hypothetical protein n=1 Tax=Streptomyces microflavus TaxID=1919 RepID=UPI0033B7AE87
MTAHHSIFIHPGVPGESLTADVATALGTRLVPVARYQVIASLRDFGGDRERERASAEPIFNRLAELRRYWLALVFDLQAVIATAAPPKRETFPPPPSGVMDEL